MSIELKACPFCGGRAVMKAVNKEYGRKLRSQQSKEVGYGPVCYKRVFGTSMRIRDGDSKTGTASDDFPYYEIPGQMSIEDFIKADEK